MTKQDLIDLIQSQMDVNEEIFVMVGGQLLPIVSIERELKRDPYDGDFDSYHDCLKVEE